MSLNTSEPTDGSPYIYRWLTATGAPSIDLTNTTADVAPALLFGLDDPSGVQFSFATDDIEPMTWHMVLSDGSRRDQDDNAAVIRVIEFVSTPGAVSRRWDADGTGGAYIHNEVLIDLRGLHARQNTHLQWHMVLTTTPTTAAYIVGYKWFDICE